MSEDCTEEWRDIPGYEGLYQVSSFGRVRSLSRVTPCNNQYASYGRMFVGKILKTFPMNKMNSDHLAVSLHKGKVQFRALVHRLVLEAFVGPCPEGMMSCHFPDRDPMNNRLDNLRWGTHADNEKDKDIHGTRVRGEDIGTSKLTTNDVIEIRRLYSESVCTRKQLANTFNVSKSTIDQILCRKRWAHV